ncbi:MAG: 50S ribosomal protein L18 [Cyanobacteria bacterium REEB446]|nr:50S ribosomal protein L18 [Cyanobacteria bacterium REEB446]
MAVVLRNIQRKKRHFRARKKIVGTELRPRLSVFRSNKHISAQVIIDVDPSSSEPLGSKTICGIATYSPTLKTELDTGSDIPAAELVGKKIAELAKAQGVTKVVFDKGGNLYHGRIKALADAAREAGLEF